MLDIINFIGLIDLKFFMLYLDVFILFNLLIVFLDIGMNLNKVVRYFLGFVLICFNLVLFLFLRFLRRNGSIIYINDNYWWSLIK